MISFNNTMLRSAEGIGTMEREPISKNRVSPKNARVGKTIMLFAFALCSLIFTSCKKDKQSDEPAVTVLERDYFTVQNGTVHKGAIPSSASGISIADDITINRNAITGGSSYVSLASEQTIKEVYVSVEGIDYYYSVTPRTPQQGSSQAIVPAAQASVSNYSFVILFSQNLNISFKIQVVVRFNDGSLSRINTTNITTIAAGTGSLQINLSFDNETDVDLYVVQPDGEIVYYGNGGDYYVEDGEIKGWGLDVDSNAGCDIDGINNENIFYSNRYIQSGKYEVWVNMYSNCDPYTPTNWIVTALYEGALVSTTYGQNPAYGVFPVNTPSNSIGASLDGARKVLEFSLNNVRSGSVSVSANKQTRSPLTESAKAKLLKANE